MRFRTFLFVWLALVGCGDVEPVPLLLRNVRILDVRTGQVGKPVDISIRGQSIESIGTFTGSTSREIDLKGSIVMPGLCDMHVHLSRPEDLAAFLVNGVTTVRDMRGSPFSLRLRREVRRATLRGPTILCASPALMGASPFEGFVGVRVVSDRSDLLAITREFARAGYDGVKIHDGLLPEQHKFAIEAAHKAGLPAWGHVGSATRVEDAIRWGQNSVEHVEPWFEASRNPARTRVRWSDAWVSAFVGRKRQLDSIEWETLRRGFVAVPTLVAQESFFDAARAEALADEFVPLFRKSWWSLSERPALETRFRELLRARTRDLILRLAEQSVPIACGTDAGLLYVQHGSSIHREIRALSDAGLSNRQCLEAATWSAARLLGPSAKSRFGVIEPGMRADILVLEANPLDDLDALRSIAGLVVRGEYLSKEGLARERRRLLQAVKRDDPLRLVRIREVPGEVVWQARYRVSRNGRPEAEEQICVTKEQGGVLVGYATLVQPEPYIRHREDRAVLDMDWMPTKIELKRHAASGSTSATLHRDSQSVSWKDKRRESISFPDGGDVLIMTPSVLPFLGIVRHMRGRKAATWVGALVDRGEREIRAQPYSLAIQRDGSNLSGLLKTDEGESEIRISCDERGFPVEIEIFGDESVLYERIDGER